MICNAVPYLMLETRCFYTEDSLFYPNTIHWPCKTRRVKLRTISALKNHTFQVDAGNPGRWEMITVLPLLLCVSGCDHSSLTSHTEHTHHAGHTGLCSHR